MRYLVPPIVIPILVVVAVVAYSLLWPPLAAGHPADPAVKVQSR
jgi:hypothetical protein